MGFLSYLFDRLFGPAPVPPTPPNPPVPSPLGEIDQELLDLHNKQRGSRSLQINSKLTAAAVNHAKNMALKGKMSHTLDGKGVSHRAEAQGYKWTTVGENIAYGYPDAKSVFQGWMNSPGHRSNILNKNYADVGFGVAKGNNGRFYWCTVFGRGV